MPALTLDQAREHILSLARGEFPRASRHIHYVSHWLFDHFLCVDITKHDANGLIREYVPAALRHPSTPDTSVIRDALPGLLSAYHQVQIRDQDIHPDVILFTVGVDYTFQCLFDPVIGALTAYVPDRDGRHVQAIIVVKVTEDEGRLADRVEHFIDLVLPYTRNPRGK